MHFLWFMAVNSIGGRLKLALTQERINNLLCSLLVVSKSKSFQRVCLVRFGWRKEQMDFYADSLYSINSENMFNYQLINSPFQRSVTVIPSPMNNLTVYFGGFITLRVVTIPSN